MTAARTPRAALAEQRAAAWVRHVQILEAHLRTAQSTRDTAIADAQAAGGSGYRIARDTGVPERTVLKWGARGRHADTDTTTEGAQQ